MQFELREERVSHHSNGVVEVTERRIVTRNETEIDSKFFDMEVGHRRNMKKSEDHVTFSIVRVE